MSLCQKCKKRQATHRIRITVDEDRPMRPAPEPGSDLEFHGPLWAMDATGCGPCIAEVGMLVAAQTVGTESN